VIKQLIKQFTKQKTLPDIPCRLSTKGYALRPSAKPHNKIKILCERILFVQNKMEHNNIETTGNDLA
jgi:hypothetical protein